MAARKKISRHFFYFNDYHLFDNAIFSSDILLYVAYGDVCKKANIALWENVLLYKLLSVYSIGATQLAYI